MDFDKQFKLVVAVMIFWILFIVAAVGSLIYLAYKVLL
jgi:hypothetical protein